MTVCAKSILKTSFNLLNKRVFKQLTFNTERQLYSKNNLGINGYLSTRDYVKTRFRDLNRIFFEKMQNAVVTNECTIFNEDLKTMIHLIEKKPEHLDLLYKMLKVFNVQKNMSFKSYVFGPVIMRAFYHLDEPDFALQILKDPDLHMLFDQISSYTIVLDMLYNHNKFKQVREVYEILKVKHIHGIVYPKNPLILTMGACYRENTEESFQYALDLLKEMKNDYILPRRATSFAAALAIKQNNPEAALEILSLDRNIRHIDHRCIKLDAYTMLNRIDEIIIILSNSLHTENTVSRKQKFFSDTIENIETFLKNKKSDEYDKISNIVKQLRLEDFVDSLTLEQHLLIPIEHIVYYSDPQRERTSDFETKGNAKSNQYNKQFYPKYNRYSKYRYNIDNRNSNYRNNIANRNSNYGNSIIDRNSNFRNNITHRNSNYRNNKTRLSDVLRE